MTNDTVYVFSIHQRPRPHAKKLRVVFHFWTCYIRIIKIKTFLVNRYWKTLIFLFRISRICFFSRVYKQTALFITKKAFEHYGTSAVCCTYNKWCPLQLLDVSKEATCWVFHTTLHWWFQDLVRFLGLVYAKVPLNGMQNYYSYFMCQKKPWHCYQNVILEMNYLGSKLNLVNLRTHQVQQASKLLFLKFYYLIFGQINCT